MKQTVRQTLYLKYRPSHFAALVGQEVVARTLSNSVRDGRLSHAYLFTGIRGTGKTSAARILARAINCERPNDGEPCDSCPTCREIAGSQSMDVIEVDAATNRGIDEIRDLRERAQFLPSHAKVKVYIIDEAHMLTAEAGNAFLKTLEEPPAHACFILATTEPLKLAETVRSRCQHFEFRRIPMAAMAEHLSAICAKERVSTDAEAMALVAEAAAGSLRDALSLLDRMIGLGEDNLNRDAVQRALGLADPKALERLAQGLAQSEAALAWRELQSLQEAGVDPRQLVRSLGAVARRLQWESLAVVGAGSVKDSAPPGFWLQLMAACASAGAELRRADDPWMFLEAMLLRLSLPAETVQAGAEPLVLAPSRDRGPLPEPVIQVAGEGTGRGPAEAPLLPPSELPELPALTPSGPPRPLPRSPEAVAAVSPERDAAGLAPPASEPAPATAAAESWLGIWPEVLSLVRPDHAQLYALLRDGRLVGFDERVLVVSLEHQFHFEQLQLAHNQQVLLEACRKLLGEPLTLRVVQAAEDASGKSPKAAGPSAVSAALKVFPGSRVTRVGSPDR